jgi:hypothetical protein
MHDLSSVPALLALARDVLVSELMPFLPEERRADALLVAESMAIAERAAEGGAEPMQLILRELELFYEREGSHPVPPPPQPSPACGGAKGGSNAGVLLRRFARDVREGAVESSEPLDRAARAILWRLTIARLRQTNPNFLAANGFD